MINRVVKWLICTVLIGLIPIATRLLIKNITNDFSLATFAPADIISFGFVLHMSIINEIEHLPDHMNDIWKVVLNRVSFILIVLYSSLFGVIILDNGKSFIVNDEQMLETSFILILVSFSISISVYYRLSKALDAGEIQ